MAEENKSFDIENSSVQIAPNAQFTVQNFYGTDYLKPVMLNKKCSEDEAPEGTILDMYYYSDTKPCPVSNEIIRKAELALCEKRLENDNVLCLYGDDGVGVTTLLAQFAKLHGENCVSHFYDGLEIIRIDTNVMERCIVSQLYWYVNGRDDNFNSDTASQLTIEALWFAVNRKIRRTGKPLYFVFDGFDSIPMEKRESVKRFLEKMYWNSCKFIFAGKKSDIKQFIPSTTKLSISEYEIITFGDADVKEYFRQSLPDVSNADLEALCQITRGRGRRMEIILHRYVEKGKLRDLLESNASGTSDLYDDDFNHIFGSNDRLTLELFAMLVYTDFPLQVPVASAILSVSKEEFLDLVNLYHEFIQITPNDVCFLNQEGFHKYLRDKLKSLKQDMELKILRVIQEPQYMLAHASFIPPLMKTLHMTDKLVTFLSKDNIQKIFVKQRSQAALNEQCEFGYDACKNEPEKYAATLFRFALNKSMSREIEKNELWDNELEALLATGHTEQALALAQNVYLSEERLKSYLLIARKKERLSPSDYEMLKESIDQLVSTIQFEKIPSKSVELAKLLLPIDYEAAIGIVDRVAKANKESINADRVYTLMSLMSNKADSETGNVTNFDMASQKIEDDGLRTFTHAAKNLFSDVSVDVFLEELAKLPSNSQKLHLLQIWLPEHEDKAGIGKAILEAIHLIIAVSDTDMPKAKILNTVCHSMSKMTAEEQTKAMVYIESISDIIKYPTFDFVDAELTIIEATKDILPEKSKSHLEYLYLYICDLEDESVKVACLSKLLGRFDYLGKRSETEKTLGCSSADIRREIIQLIHHLLQETAYHLKVVEEPIKALVCDYPTMIDELIADINTQERKRRAYSLAAMQYLLKQEEEKVKLDKFFVLIAKTDNADENRETPLDLLSRMLLHAEKINHEEMLPIVKSEFHYFEELERSSRKVLIFMRLYLWMTRHFPEDTFANKIKGLILQNWNSIEVLKARIECGFFLAKNFAKVSKDDAEDILKQCHKMKAECFLASSSCVSAYDIAIELYVHSMSLLIRYKLCDDDTLLRQFAEDIDTQLSSGEKAIIWSNIALEFFLSDKHQQFDTLCSKYFPTNYDSYSLMDQKCIIYSIAPAMFFHSRDTLYTLLDRYDDQFKNDVLKRISEFIFCKEGMLSGISAEYKAYDLEFKDYQDIIGLLEHASNDEIFFHVVNVVAKSLRDGKHRDELSTDQKNMVVNEIERIVNEKLPSSDGIQHDGYKIACLSALKHSKSEFTSKDKDYWENEIAKVDNKADKSFLYLQIAPYFQKKHDKSIYFEKGISEAESISSTFDKVKRLDMSIDECVENNLGNLVRPMAETAMKSLRLNGTLEDYKRLIDMVYQHKPDLAEEMVNNLDNDPARVQYKNRLLSHISSAKRLKEAHDKLDSIDKLKTYEQVRFFEKQLNNLINGTGQILDVDKIFDLSIKHIYNHNIDKAKYAIVYVMEDLFRKFKQSKQNKDLLLNIHSAFRYNLKLVLSLAVDTKERLDRVESLMQTRSFTEEGYIQIGEEAKARAYILNWYQKCEYDTLTIIDPYFKPQDLSIIKHLCDINNDLEIKILTHRQKFENDDYLSSWHHFSSGVTNTITLHFVWYDGKPEDGPLHDRFWICSDEENDEHQGITLCSVDSLGKKESSITEVDGGIVLSALMSYTKYVYNRPKKIVGRELRYDEMELE